MRRPLSVALFMQVVRCSRDILAALATIDVCPSPRLSGEPYIAALGSDIVAEIAFRMAAAIVPSISRSWCVVSRPRLRVKNFDLRRDSTTRSLLVVERGSVLSTLAIFLTALMISV